MCTARGHAWRSRAAAAASAATVAAKASGIFFYENKLLFSIFIIALAARCFQRVPFMLNGAEIYKFSIIARLTSLIERLNRCTK